MADNLADGLRRNGYAIKIGCLGSKYLLQAPAENGHSDAAYQVVTKKIAPVWECDSRVVDDPSGSSA